MFTNIVSNVSGISAEEDKYGNYLIETDRGWILQSEQKSVALVMDLRQKISKPFDLVLSAIAGNILQRKSP